MEPLNRACRGLRVHAGMVFSSRQGLPLMLKNTWQGITSVSQNFTRPTMYVLGAGLGVTTVWLGVRSFTRAGIVRGLGNRSAAGVTTVEFTVQTRFMGGQPAVHCCSQGVKALVTAMKLNQAQKMWADVGRAPVVLMDDLGAELDDAHQREILRHMLSDTLSR